MICLHYLNRNHNKSISLIIIKRSYSSSNDKFDNLLELIKQQNIGPKQKRRTGLINDMERKKIYNEGKGISGNEKINKKQKFEKFNANKATNSSENSITANLNSPFKLKVISNGYLNTPKSFLLQGISKNYLFNCGESTQRIMGESKLKLSKLEHLFITRKSWDCVGGLVGLLLSFQDTNNYIGIHAPFEIKNALQNTMKYAHLLFPSMQQYSYDMNKPFEDGILSVKAIELIEDSKLKLHEILTDTDSDVSTASDDNESNEPKRAKLDDINLSSESIDSYIEQKSKNIVSENDRNEYRVFAYLIKINKKLPKLLPEKLKELKVPSGPLYSKLKSGQDVTLDDGRIVYAKDVVDSSKSKDVNILVLDCPTRRYLKFVKNNAEINDSSIDMIVHLSSTLVLNHPEFLEWFKQKTSQMHLILDNNYNNIDSSKIYNLQTMLNLVDNQVFPYLPLKSPTAYDQINKSPLMKEIEGNEKLKIVYGVTNTTIDLRDDCSVSTDDCYKPIDEKKLNEILIENSGDINMRDKLANFRNEINEIRSKQTVTNNDDIYPIVTFLGTGSSRPSSTRNVSGILVKINEEKSILLDCGEGTVTQMTRLYGPHMVNTELRKIKAVFLSHYHSDHMQGLLYLIIKRIRAFRDMRIPYERLCLILPTNILGWINEYFGYYEKLNIKIIIYKSNGLFDVEDDNTSKRKKYEIEARNDEIEKVCRLLALKSFQTVRVNHVPQSMALIMEIKSSKPFKLVYSGDCRPTEALAKYGANCDLLIHEGTFDESFQTEAILKKHSTISEAIDIGRKMNAKTIVLWHFSQRYAKIPLLNILKDDDEQYLSNLIVSFDNMILRRNDIEILPKFNSLLKVLFKNYHIEAEESSLKRLQD